MTNDNAPEQLVEALCAICECPLGYFHGINSGCKSVMCIACFDKVRQSATKESNE